MKHDTLTTRQVLRQLEDMGVITAKQREKIWQDYWLHKVKKK